MTGKNGKQVLRPLSEIEKDGFVIPGTMRNLKGFALLSLRIALRAYFSTYKAMESRLHVFTDPSSKQEKDHDYLHSTDYCSLYGQIVVHFQHFAELVCKDILRAEHDLMAVDAAARPVLQLKLLKGEEISPSEYESLKSVEFGVALKRVLELLKADRLDKRFEFLKEAQSLLEMLNNLRNRLLHRGTFVLRYPALDELAGAHVFPLVKKVLALSEYIGQESFWKHKNLACGIDPIEEIVRDWREGKYNLKKVALLKELGRAGYEGPAWDDPFMAMLQGGDLRRAERTAAMELEKRTGAGVRECPVCGLKTLVQYDDHQTELDDQGQLVSTGTFPYLLRCMCCTFEIDFDLDNPSEYGLPIADLWV